MLLPFNTSQLHTLSMIMEQNKVLMGLNNIDEVTMRQMMGYLKIDNHDLFAGYVKRLGIDHKD